MRGPGGDGLNPAQRTAVTTLTGPLLVLAGAGTGKTRVITVRIAELIKSGITPSRILAVTFTNKAAREMRERAQGLIGRKKKGVQGPEISTFHSLCVRILRRQATKLGYPENFSIYDRGDQESLARGALRDIRVGHQKLRPGDLINQISTWKSAGITPNEAEGVSKTDVQILSAMAYGRYQAGLRSSGAMDFDDLLLNTEKLFTEHPEARFAEASRFDHLLIDEYQDTNGLQYRIVKSLADRHRNLCVVGDDDQSIYGWRGAEVEHILHFKDHWPEARVVRLEDNYRCTEWIIHLANTLIAHNKARHDKVLRAARGRGAPPRFLKFDDETMEAESIVREIHAKISREDSERVPASDIAILFRTNEQPRAFETELRRLGVPYILIGGQSFFDRKEVKDLLSYLRVLANPSDEVSLLRIINTPSRGIGTSTVQTLLDEAVAHGDPLWKLLPAATAHPSIASGAANAIDGFQKLINEFRARLPQQKLSALLGELIQRIDYKGEIERQFKDPNEHEARWNAVESFVNAVVTYENRTENPSLLGFLEETTLSSRDDEKDDDKKQQHSVTLMTLHSAKGLEFPHVYLVGLEEGQLPHKRSVADLNSSAIDEERRLAYVGVTRAKDELSLSYCANRLKWGKLRPQIPSRFLLEMRGETAKANELAALATTRIREELERAREAEEGDGKKGKKGKKRDSAEGASSRRKPKEPASNEAAAPATRVKKSEASSRSAPPREPSPAPRTSAERPPESAPSAASSSDFQAPAMLTERDLMAERSRPRAAPPATAAPSTPPVVAEPVVVAPVSAPVVAPPSVITAPAFAAPVVVAPVVAPSTPLAAAPVSVVMDPVVVASPSPAPTVASPPAAKNVVEVAVAPPPVAKNDIEVAVAPPAVASPIAPRAEPEPVVVETRVLSETPRAPEPPPAPPALPATPTAPAAGPASTERKSHQFQQVNLFGDL